jgi:hypothetical protein
MSLLGFSCLLDTTGKGPDDPEPVAVEEPGEGSGYYEGGWEPMFGCQSSEIVELEGPNGEIWVTEIPIPCDPYWELKDRPDYNPVEEIVNNPSVDPWDVLTPEERFEEQGQL